MEQQEINAIVDLLLSKDNNNKELAYNQITNQYILSEVAEKIGYKLLLNIVESAIPCTYKNYWRDNEIQFLGEFIEEYDLELHKVHSENSFIISGKFKLTGTNLYLDFFSTKESIGRHLYNKLKSCGYFNYYIKTSIERVLSWKIVEVLMKERKQLHELLKQD